MADELYVRVSLRDLVETHREIKSLFEENAKLKERAEYFKGISEAVTEGSKILSRDWMTAMEENHRLEEENAELKREAEEPFSLSFSLPQYASDVGVGPHDTWMCAKKDEFERVNAEMSRLEALCKEQEEEIENLKRENAFFNCCAWEASISSVTRALDVVSTACRDTKHAVLKKLALDVVEYDDAENEKIKVGRVSDHPISLLKDYLETRTED